MYPLPIGVNFLSFTPSGRKENHSNERMIEWMNVEKSHKCLHMPTILVFLSQGNRDYSTLTRQLEAIIIELSAVQVLRLSTNPQRDTGQNLQKSPTVMQSFAIVKLAILT